MAASSSTWRWVDPTWLIDNVVEFRRAAYERVLGNPVSDLFTAAAEQHLRSHAPLAARLRPRTLDDVVGQEHLVGPGQAVAPPGRAGPADQRDLLGPARHRQDHAGAGGRRQHQTGLRTDERRQCRDQGCARRDRAGPPANRRARQGHDPVPRRDPPVQQGAAGRTAARRRGRHVDDDRRDHREPVLRSQPAVAQPQHAVPSGAARPRRDRDPGAARSGGRGDDSDT